MSLRSALALGVCLPLALLASTTASGQDKEKGATEAKAAKTAEDIAANWASAPVVEVAKSRKGQVSVGGRSIAYTETAGTLTLRDVNGKPIGSMFYTAYTAPSAGGKRRPVTFLYNGGPGSSTLWLRMGSFAPMRVETDAPQAVAPAPYPVVPNPDTLIGSTDMVFLDAMGAGYSRPLGDTPVSDFYGFDKDVDAFAKAITRYVTINKRWGDPKYIFGESYGTPRSAALAYKLEDQGMALNGVILLSSIMNYGVRQPGYPQNYVTLLPTYAATAWYHRKLANPAATVEEQVQRARDFALGPYASALAKGHMISDAERADIVRQMSDLTGLSTTFIDNANMRVDLGAFRKELLRDRRQTIGRLDTRYMGLDEDAAGGEPEDDPSSSAVTGAYFGIFRDYVANELNYKTDVEYRMSARGLPGFNWNWSHRPPVGGPQTTPNTAIDLATAMRRNPYLKVMSLNGYYDAATPFFSTEFDLAQMMLEPSLRPNLEFTYYEGGHMMYLSHDALVKLHADLSRFYAETANGGVR